MRACRASQRDKKSPWVATPRIGGTGEPSVCTLFSIPCCCRLSPVSPCSHVCYLSLLLSHCRHADSHPFVWDLLPAEEFEIFFKDNVGRTKSLEITLNDTVAQIKQKIQDKDGTPPDEQYLLLPRPPTGAIKLKEDHLTVAQLGIRKGVRTLWPLLAPLSDSAVRLTHDACVPSPGHAAHANRPLCARGLVDR